LSGLSPLQLTLTAATNLRQSGPSPHGRALRCSFPKAEIGEGAQQSDAPEVSYADEDETALAVLALIAGDTR